MITEYQICTAGISGRTTVGILMVVISHGASRLTPMYLWHSAPTSLAVALHYLNLKVRVIRVIFFSGIHSKVWHSMVLALHFWFSCTQMCMNTDLEKCFYHLDQIALHNKSNLLYSIMVKQYIYQFFHVISVYLMHTVRHWEIHRAYTGLLCFEFSEATMERHCLIG